MLVLTGTVCMALLDHSTPTDVPNTAFGTEPDGEKLVLKHTSGDSISPSNTDYISITGNENVTIEWNDNVTNSTARSSNREAVVTDSITAGTEIAVVSNASTADSLRFVWFAVDGTGYTLLSDITPPDGGGVDAGENSTSSVGGSLGRTVTAGIE